MMQMLVRAARDLLIPPLKGEGPARSAGGGVGLRFAEIAPTRLASLTTLPRKRGRDKEVQS